MLPLLNAEERAQYESVIGNNSHCDACYCITGDVDQLPPVGPGKVLSDVIRSGVVPGVDLREIFRQAQRSSIVRTAHAVNNGDFGAVQSSLATLNAQALQVTLPPFALPIQEQKPEAQMSSCAGSHGGAPILAFWSK